MLEMMLYIDGWEWEKRSLSIGYDFWITKDPAGNSWIVKFKGSFYSYREWVFSRLATRLGLNVRRAELVWISKKDLLHTGQENSEPYQLLLQFIDKHNDGSCSPSCPFPELRRHFQEESDIGEFVASVSPYNAADCILKDLLADMFGANEPSEWLFGTDHKFYIIDNELMFSTEPSGKISAPWLFARNGSYSKAGHKLLFDLCSKIVSLGDADLRDISKYPKGYKIDMLWPILPILRKGKKVARSILRNGPTYYNS